VSTGYAEERNLSLRAGALLYSLRPQGGKVKHIIQKGKGFSSIESVPSEKKTGPQEGMRVEKADTGQVLGVTRFFPRIGVHASWESREGMTRH